MAKAGDYEIDDQGNLVESGTEEPAQGADGEIAERPVSAADRTRFLRLLLLSDVVGVLALGGGAILLPESRTILLVLAVAYAVVAVPIYVWMSRQTQRKVEESQRRQVSS